ncbi:MAG: DUF2169 domain-containing protein [Sandaracinaceae bacterium]
MRGIKPFKLSFMTRPFSWGQSHQLGVSVIAYAQLAPEPDVYTDAEMWTEVPEVMGKDVAIDEGIPKSRSEFIVMGSAYQPDGVPGTLRRVRVKVGALEKSLNVIGDRFWNRDVPTEPLPFVSMPLDWEHAFGGEGFEHNPRGKGFAPITNDDGQTLHPLPNVEQIGNMVTSPKDRPTPASFGVVDFTWPQRIGRAGTYDKAWLDTRFPGFAEDMQWQMWNLAAEDQQQEAPWRGDERIECDHLHPTETRLEGRLPGLGARAFVSQRRGEDLAFEEVGLRLTTVYVLPPIGRVILIWQGAQPVVEDDGEDIECLMIAGERLGQTRPFEHYRAVYERRSGPDRALEILKDEDLFPADLCGMSPEVGKQTEACTPENLPMQRQHKAMVHEVMEARARIAEAGLDPDEHGPKIPDPLPAAPSMDELNDVIEEKKKEAQKALAQAAEARSEARAKAKAFYESVGLDWAEVEEEMVDTPRGPPTYRAEVQQAEFNTLADRAEAAGQPVDELRHMGTDPEFYALMKEREKQERENYQRTAHTQRPAFASPEEVSAARRAKVQTALQRGESLAGWDLTGVDLSQMDLSGADFRKAFLESVRFSGTTAKGANFQGAVLAHADLSGANFEGARFSHANLGSAVLRGARLVGADLSATTLDKADLHGADLSGANLRQIAVTSGKLEGAILRGAALGGAKFMEVSLSGVDFQGAELVQTLFYKVKLDQLDFSGAQMREATFVECSMRECRFVNAKMVGIRTVMDCVMSRSDLKGADLSRANLRGTKMTQCDLSGARLDDADLSTADLSDSRLYRAVAKRSLWQRTTLQRASLVSANLFEAVLDKADLRGADLRGANLYGANFSLIHSDEATRVEDALQDRVRVLPLREPPEEVTHEP